MTISTASLTLFLCVATATSAASGDSVLLRATKSGKETTMRRGKKKNIYGKDLQMCSTEGMALTGFTRDGRCVEEQDDAGSHHICIDLASISATGKNFCAVTEQPDWCDDEKACADDSEEQCPVKDWCVCQWAFAAYIEKAGGCDAIQDINCEATNMEALIAYKKKQGDDQNVANALKCLEQRCKLDADFDIAIAR